MKIGHIGKEVLRMSDIVSQLTTLHGEACKARGRSAVTNIDPSFLADVLFETAAEIDRLRAALATKEAETLERASPEEIAAAWAAWHSRHGGKLGPGPAFVEAINAAFAKRAAAIQAMKEAKS
jgi:hypothetical protein